MSNVLIGIAGVILFLGLIAVGAFYLGDTWRASQRDAQAVAVLEQCSQVAAAVVLRRAALGQEIPGNADLETILVQDDFLKAVPSSPYGTSYGVHNPTDVTSALPALVVLVSVGTNEGACQTIESRSLLVSPPVTLPAVSSTVNVTAGILRQTGCFQAVNGIPHLGVPAGGYVAYARL